MRSKISNGNFRLPFIYLEKVDFSNPHFLAKALCFKQLFSKYSLIVISYPLEIFVDKLFISI